VEKRNYLHQFGERLAQERARLGLTQADLAEHAGIARRTQINYERGERAPDATYLHALDARGIDPLFLITGRAAHSTVIASGYSPLTTPHVAEPGATYQITGLSPAVVRAATRAVLVHVQQDLALPDAALERIAEAVIVLCEMSKSPDEVEKNATLVLRLLDRNSAQ
jgi:DNA-binding XRE family transcriptional regulator